VDGVQVGEAEAFAAWVEPHWGLMHRHAARLVGVQPAEDVLQDALILAWRKRDHFDPARGTPRAWLLALVADQSRKHRRRVRPTVELEDDVPDESPAFDESGVDLGRHLAGLSDRQRVAVSLYYYADLPVTEIAQAMGCSVGTVKSTLSDARGRLRALLGKDY
jgi:RNA polymerase sigma-70 factor, ECF subfamily